ncbi:MAG: DUF3501 family protein [Thiohalomonadaceae bacterium]
MEKLTPADLLTLEAYARERHAFRRRVIAHKRLRQVNLGPHALLHFEDRLTMQYQIQEMLRVERIFEPQAVQDELDAYNPLIPDGRNWKATLMLEFPDPEERSARLAALRGIERATYVQIKGHDKVFPVANEDLERDNGEKTSSVHFMRFELTPEMIAAVKDGARLAVGTDHPHYTHRADVPDAVRQALIIDLD